MKVKSEQYTGSEEQIARLGVEKCTEKRDGLRPVPKGFEVLGATVMGFKVGERYVPIKRTNWIVTLPSGNIVVLEDDVFQPLKEVLT